MADDLSDPTVFLARFHAEVQATPTGAAGDREQTRWFGRRMQALAKHAGWHCQNLQTGSPGRPGEWMAVDHVFVRNLSYEAFPLVAVEHENRNISKETEAAVVPQSTSDGAYIEWALWKVLSMRCKLGVLVAYPWTHDRVALLSVLAAMVEGFTREYDSRPSLLLILRWWHQDATQNVGSPYEVFAPAWRDDRVTLLSFGSES